MTYKPASTSPHARQWLEAGLAAHRAGDLERACHAYRQVLAFAPEHPDALNLLGTALLQSGAAEDAMPLLERAASADRNNPHLLANLGQCALALGRYDAAHDAFRRASRIDPSEPQFQLGVASALALGGKLRDAENILRRLAKRQPDSALVWLNLGHVMRDQARRQEAIDCYDKAVGLEPESAEARNALGSAFHSKLRFAEAEAQYRACLALAPDHPSALFNLSSVLMDLGRFEESERVARELQRGRPDAPEAFRLLGAALGFQTRLVEAHACYERAAQLDPTSAKAAETLAMSYAETGRLQEGLRWFARALELEGDASSVAPLRAAALLADGAIHDGWRDYRHRVEAKLFREKNPATPITQQIVEAADGKHVCIIGEQGLGDEVFFLRYAHALAARGARLTYRAGSKIAPLLARLPFLARVIDSGAELPQADAYVLVADLPHALYALAQTEIDTRVPTIAAMRDQPRRIALHYPPVPPSIVLEAQPDRIANMRERLATLGGPPYIGLTWRAGTLPEEQRSTNWALFKSVPVETLAAALSKTRGTLLALQRAPHEGEIIALARSAGRAVHDFSALNDDLETMLALLSLIDEYVAVSNTNVHLRAAVGRSSRVLVPAPAEWRWMRSGVSPWFPKCSIYRQTLEGDWAGALRRLENDIASSQTPPGTIGA